MTDLPDNLKDFEGMFYPGSVRTNAAKPADTLALEYPLPPETRLARIRRIGSHAVRRALHAPRTRSYGLGIALGSAAVATGIAVAFLTPPHAEAPAARPRNQLIIKPLAPTRSANAKPTPSTPTARPSHSFRLLLSGLRTVSPTHHESMCTPSNTSDAAPHASLPAAPTWTATTPAVPLPIETSATPTATDIPPSDTPTMPLQTPQESTSADPEMPPTSLSPSPGG